MRYEPVWVCKLRARLRPGALTPSRKRAEIRRQLAEWEAQQEAVKSEERISDQT